MFCKHNKFSWYNIIYETIASCGLFDCFFKLWNVLALDGSNWQRVNLFAFQRDIEVII